MSTMAARFLIGVAAGTAPARARRAALMIVIALIALL
jgi:hypothetical protein